MQIELQLGGHVIHLREPHDYPCLAWPIRPFDMFLAQPGSKQDFEIDVDVCLFPPRIEARAHSVRRSPRLLDGLRVRLRTRHREA